MTSAYENAMSNMQAENYTQTYPVTQNQAAEARAAQAEQERDGYKEAAHDWHMNYLDAIAKRDELRAAFFGQVKTIEELRRQLGQVTQERDNLRMSIVNNVSA